jgi:hypothetical protein
MSANNEMYQIGFESNTMQSKGQFINDYYSSSCLIIRKMKLLFHTERSVLVDFVHELFSFLFKQNKYAMSTLIYKQV